MFMGSAPGRCRRQWGLFQIREADASHRWRMIAQQSEKRQPGPSVEIWLSVITAMVIAACEGATDLAELKLA
tara:strand:+ start:5212 stop:5427 length:216 start_codon:yes stop_codon:yes gene_type:complete